MLDGAEELPELDLGFVLDGNSRPVIAEPKHEAASSLEEPSHRNGVDSDGGPGSRNGLHPLASHRPDVDFLDHPVVAHVQRVVFPHLEAPQSSAVNGRQEVLDARGKVFQFLVLQFAGRGLAGVVGQVAAPMGLLVEGEHHVAVAPALPGDLGEPIGAEPLGRHQRLEVVLDGHAGQPGQYSGRDRVGRDPEQTPSPFVFALLEFESQFAGADGGDEEQPGRRVPTDLVDESLSPGNDFGRVGQAIGMEPVRPGEGQNPGRQQDRCGDWEARPHISPRVGIFGLQSTKAPEGKKDIHEGPRRTTKGHEEQPKEKGSTHHPLAAALRASPHFSPGGMIMAQDFFLQRVLATEERSGFYGRGSMCALEEKRPARACPAQSVCIAP